MNKKTKLVPGVVGGYAHSSVNYRELGDWRGAQRKLEMRWLTTKLRQKRFGKCRNGNYLRSHRIYLAYQQFYRVNNVA